MRPVLRPHAGSRSRTCKPRGLSLSRRVSTPILSPGAKRGGLTASFDHGLSIILVWPPPHPVHYNFLNFRVLCPATSIIQLPYRNRLHRCQLLNRRTPLNNLPVITLRAVERNDLLLEVAFDPQLMLVVWHSTIDVAGENLLVSTGRHLVLGQAPQEGFEPSGHSRDRTISNRAESAKLNSGWSVARPAPGSPGSGRTPCRSSYFLPATNASGHFDRPLLSQRDNHYSPSGEAPRLGLEPRSLFTGRSVSNTVGSPIPLSRLAYGWKELNLH